MIPQHWSPLRIAVAMSLLLIPCALVTWYQALAPIESLDRLAYCGCGYSTVSFHDGRITMVEFHHDTVKPGQQIGTYRVLNNDVQLEIIFNGKSRKMTLAMDNIGILDPQPAFLQYYALNNNSPKTYIHFGMVRLRSSLSNLWSELHDAE